MTTIMNANISKVKTNKHTLYFEGLYFTDITAYKAYVGTNTVKANTASNVVVTFDWNEISNIKTSKHEYYAEGHYFTGPKAYKRWVIAHKTTGQNSYKTA